MSGQWPDQNNGYGHPYGHGNNYGNIYNYNVPHDGRMTYQPSGPPPPAPMARAPPAPVSSRSSSLSLPPISVVKGETGETLQQYYSRTDPQQQPMLPPPQPPSYRQSPSYQQPLMTQHASPSNVAGTGAGMGYGYGYSGVGGGLPDPTQRQLPPPPQKRASYGAPTGSMLPYHEPLESVRRSMSIPQPLSGSDGFTTTPPSMYAEPQHGSGGPPTRAPVQEAFMGTFDQIAKLGPSGWPQPPTTNPQPLASSTSAPHSNTEPAPTTAEARLPKNTPKKPKNRQPKVAAASSSAGGRAAGDEPDHVSVTPKKTGGGRGGKARAEGSARATVPAPARAPAKKKKGEAAAAEAAAAEAAARISREPSQTPSVSSADGSDDDWLPPDAKSRGGSPTGSSSHESSSAAEETDSSDSSDSSVGGKPRRNAKGARATKPNPLTARRPPKKPKRQRTLTDLGDVAQTPAPADRTTPLSRSNSVRTATPLGQPGSAKRRSRLLEVTPSFTGTDKNWLGKEVTVWEKGKQVGTAFAKPTPDTTNDMFVNPCGKRDPKAAREAKERQKEEARLQAEKAEKEAKEARKRARDEKKREREAQQAAGQAPASPAKKR